MYRPKRGRRSPFRRRSLAAYSYGRAFADHTVGHLDSEGDSTSLPAGALISVQPDALARLSSKKRICASAGRRYLIGCTSALCATKLVEQAKVIAPLLFISPISIEVAAGGLSHLDRFA
jgi:hypothetical protein